MCLGVFCLGFILFGTLWVYWTWVTISFPIGGKFSATTRQQAVASAVRVLRLSWIWADGLTARSMTLL